MHVHMHMHMHMHMHTCTHAHMHTCTCTHAHAHAHAHVRGLIACDRQPGRLSSQELGRGFMFTTDEENNLKGSSEP